MAVAMVGSWMLHLLLNLCMDRGGSFEFDSGLPNSWMLVFLAQRLT